MARFRTLSLAAALLGVAAVLPAGAQPRTSRAALAPRLDALLDRPGLTDGFWGVQVVDAATGQTLYSRNATRRFVPASNAKLYSGAAVLDAFGPDHRFVTRLYADGPVGSDGVLRGNLVVQGGGDPSLGSQPDDDVPADKFAVLRLWADSLRAHGLTAVAGNIVGDDDVFDEQPLGAGWTWDDEVYYYSAQLSGLSFGDNCVNVEIVPTRPGQPGRVDVPEAAQGFAEFVNATVTADSGTGIQEGYERLPGTNRFVLASRVAADARDRECLSVHNPTRYAAHAVRWALEQAGIRVSGRAVDRDEETTAPADYAAMTLLHEHASAPLAVLLANMEQHSINHYAEFFLKHVGRLPGPAPTARAPLGSAARGLAVMKEGLLARAGASPERFSLVDGSGLSRMSVVAPAQTVALLRHMHRHPHGAVFRASLPTGGAPGTLRNRLSALRSRVQAKTGTLTGASSLSGYLTTRSGRTLAFALMANHYSAPGSAVRRAQDEVLALLADL